MSAAGFVHLWWTEPTHWHCPRSIRSRDCVSVLEHCIPVSSADTHRHLRSASRHLLAVARFWLNTYGRRAFSVAGPMAWNSLPILSSGIQRDPAQTVLGVYLTRTCSHFTSASSALAVLNDCALCKSTHSLRPSVPAWVLSSKPEPAEQQTHCCRFAAVGSASRR